MANKKFSAHAQRVLNHNPNVEKCTESKISFTEEFALKVCDALKKGEDPFKVFTDAGFSIRILGKSRIVGAIGLWKSRFGLEDLPRRKVAYEPKAPAETAAERRAKNLAKAIEACDALIADPAQLELPEGASDDLIHFAAIKKVFDTQEKVIVKDLCSHYGYQYSKYYTYLQSLKPKDEVVNLLNPHRKA